MRCPSMGGHLASPNGLAPRMYLVELLLTRSEYGPSSEYSRTAVRTHSEYAPMHQNTQITFKLYWNTYQVIFDYMEAGMDVLRRGCLERLEGPFQYRQV